MDELASQPYREYLGEIPINTVRNWHKVLMDQLHWEYVGWTGTPQEPYRHWAAYPPLENEIERIWDMLDFSFRQDGFTLKPERVIANLFAHGDSSWLHRDSELSGAWTVIVYLNDFWDPNWHGGTILVDGRGEIIKAFSPTPGKFILFRSDLLHGPVPVSREAPYPRLGLTFQCVTDLSRSEETRISSLPSSKF